LKKPWLSSLSSCLLFQKVSEAFYSKLTSDGVFDSRGYSERALQKLNRPNRSSSKVDATASTSTPKPKRDSEIRTELLKSKPDLVAGFTRSIVPVLVDVFAASVSHRVRYKVLAGLLKAVAFAEPEELQIILNVSALRL
jgi:hypothetical protein